MSRLDKEGNSHPAPLPAGGALGGEDQQEKLNQLKMMMVEGRSFSGHEKNCCFLNTEAGGRFATISATSGLDFPDDGRALAIVDWDQDGYPDLWISNRNAPRLRFMHNDHPHTNHFLALKLQGDGTSTNRDAIGARVEVIAKGLNGKRLVKSLHAGEGFLSQSTKWLHFGLGKLDQIDKIIVHWPAGTKEEFTGVKADQRYLLVQSSGKAAALPPVVRKLKLEPAEQKPLPDSQIVSVPLVTHLPMPRDLGYRDFQSVNQRLTFGQGKPTLLVLWASWCVPCQKELLELTAREKDLRAAGIDIIALTVDGMSEDGSNPEDAPNFCKRKKIPFPTGRATTEIAQKLAGFHHMLVVLNRPLPIPVSFLIDRQGRLTTIYKGPVSVDELLVDAKRPMQNVRQRWEQAACLPGSLLDDDRLFASLQRIEADTCYELGNAFSHAKKFQLAADYLHMTLEADPDYQEAYPLLALMLDRAGQDEEAMRTYTQAIKYFPDRKLLHYNLGVIYQRHGRRDQALLRYREALRLDPNFPEAQQALAGLQGGGQR